MNDSEVHSEEVRHRDRPRGQLLPNPDCVHRTLTMLESTGSVAHNWPRCQGTEGSADAAALQRLPDRLERR